MFTITGPGSPSVLANMVPGIEQHVNWIGECLDYMRKNGHKAIEATVEAEGPWHLRIQEQANQTLWNVCDNWYQGPNIPGKPHSGFFGLAYYAASFMANGPDGLLGFLHTRQALHAGGQ